MDSSPEYAEVQRRIPEEEKKTVRWYVLHILMLDRKSFKHKLDGEIYTVKRQYHPNIHKSPLILTTKGRKLLLENCLDDIEVNLSEVIKAQQNK